MSTETINLIAIVLIASSGLIVVLTMVPVVIGPSNRTRQRRHDERLTELRANLPTGAQPVELDWMRYRELSKQEIADVLAEQGFRPTGERITDTAWLLTFADDHGTTDN
jgi:hypothetical protein